MSYEAYDLGDDATLVNNGFTNVGPELRALGLETYPMITTVNISRIRALAAKVRLDRHGCGRLGLSTRTTTFHHVRFIAFALFVCVCGGLGGVDSPNRSATPL